LKNQQTYLDKTAQDNSNPVLFINNASPKNNIIPL